MGIPNLESVLFFKKALNKQIEYLTESETYILISIDLMNRQWLRVSGNTLFKCLSQLYHTPSRKKMYAILNKIKAPEYDFIRETGKGSGRNYVVTLRGKQYLFHIERALEIEARLRKEQHNK